MSTIQNYLQELLVWGEEVQRKIDSLEISAEEKSSLKTQLKSWIEDVKVNTSRELAPDDEIINVLQGEAQRIVLSMKHNNNSNTEQIGYGKHKLPQLPYNYNALEPYISEAIMRLHHDVHHQAYVDGLNKAENELYVKQPDKNLVKHWLREQAFHGSGHNLHTIFWFNMTPNSDKKPSGELLKQIEKDFGTWKKFENLFSNTASSVEGDGWAVLYWNPRNGRLGVQSFEKHQLFQIADIIPLLVLDMWEHAYYLQYKTDKETYIENWWNVVNWQNVNERFAKAKKLKWALY
ncbi:superoxide dismutase [Oceanobacillus jordanicus]|uniref:superoxide dismutase n=1 Tax=Oceanobacillus jordanicus TaxID=2867266 RepID=A0AAW5B6C2_9BACI|nr:superoxide dismutase [Oceanobacillus jordanicus]MCG3418802.1 superoxide dismutase [Oceanobacillus jordanicus]